MAQITAALTALPLLNNDTENQCSCGRQQLSSDFMWEISSVFLSHVLSPLNGHNRRHFLSVSPRLHWSDVNNSSLILDKLTYIERISTCPFCRRENGSTVSPLLSKEGKLIWLQGGRIQLLEALTPTVLQSFGLCLRKKYFVLK